MFAQLTSIWFRFIIVASQNTRPTNAECLYADFSLLTGGSFCRLSIHIPILVSIESRWSTRSTFASIELAAIATFAHSLWWYACARTTDDSRRRSSRHQYFRKTIRLFVDASDGTVWLLFSLLICNHFHAQLYSHIGRISTQFNSQSQIDRITSHRCMHSSINQLFASFVSRYKLRQSHRPIDWILKSLRLCLNVTCYFSIVVS